MTACSKLVQATIMGIWQETPTVKGLQLAVDALSGFTFQPGQWVDFHAPGVQHVGGYSICSTPQDLQKLGTFELCVKASRHPCAQWVHQRAVAGDQVGVQVGGSFTLAPSSTQRPTLFVAGGIGITCLSSMLGHLVELEAAAAAAAGPHTTQPPAAAPLVQVSAPLLLYSAASPQEFALLPRLLDWQQKGLLQLQLHTTQDHGPIPSSCQQQADEVQQQPGPPVERVTGRIAEVHLQAAMQQLQQGAARAQEVDAYVCGPPSMTDEVVGLLQKLGVPSSCIRTEKWW